LFGELSMKGALAGSPVDREDTFKFTILQGISAMIEEVPLEDAANAYARMMRNEARFRMVLVTGTEAKGLPH